MISVCFLKKSRSENMQQIYKRTTMPKCDFKKVLFCNFNETELRHGCSPVNLLHIFRTLFLRMPLEGVFCPSLIKQTFSKPIIIF